MKWIGLYLVVSVLVACSTNPPLQEYTIARTAIDAAKQYEADRYSPSLWYQAEENYRRGVLAFKQEDFDQAKKFFSKAKQFAEKAENKARKEKSGK